MNYVRSFSVENATLLTTTPGKGVSSLKANEFHPFSKIKTYLFWKFLASLLDHILLSPTHFYNTSQNIV